MILHNKAPAEDLARDENTSSGSDDVFEITQSEREEDLSDIHVPPASLLEDTAFGSVEDVLKPVSLSLVEVCNGS